MKTRLALVAAVLVAVTLVAAAPAGAGGPSSTSISISSSPRSAQTHLRTGGRAAGSFMLSFGESWHNNHHAFPSSAFHGLRRFEVDPGGWVIRGLERCGLAWRVVRIPPERQRAKLAEA